MTTAGSPIKIPGVIKFPAFALWEYATVLGLLDLPGEAGFL